MFSSRFLTQAANRNASPAERSKLFTRRAAIGCNTVSEPPSLSPMTAALVSVANQRTRGPEVPSVSALVTADVEFRTEAQDTPVPKVKKSGRKRKNEVPGAPRRKRASRKKRSVEENGAGMAAVGTRPENPLIFPKT